MDKRSNILVSVRIVLLSDFITREHIAAFGKNCIREQKGKHALPSLTQEMITEAIGGQERTNQDG
jgi:hypothetical protein